MNLKKFVELTIEDDGSTYNLNTGEINPSNDYFVAIEGKESKSRLNDGSIRSKVATFVKENGFTLSLPKNFLGSWINDGYIYLDVVKRFEDKDEAVEFGRINNQIAIFDANNGEVINL